MLKVSLFLVAASACLAIPVDQTPLGPSEDVILPPRGNGAPPKEYEGEAPPPPGEAPSYEAEGPRPPAGYEGEARPPPAGEVPQQKADGSDLKTDSTFWWGYRPYYRSYHTPRYYYSYYTPYYHNYHKSYYWW